MDPAGRSAPARRRAAFTLIEMLAVVTIFALIAGLVAPNLGLLGSRRLQQQAERLSAQLELARQRAVVTGVTHRLVLDLEGSAYWLEWLVTEAEATGESAEPAKLELDGSSPIPLAPPRAAEREYRPLSGLFGRATPLEDTLTFQSVETAEGSVTLGETSVVFERDGTASYTEIVLADDDGNALVLEVLPLAEAVRIRDAES